MSKPDTPDVGIMVSFAEARFDDRMIKHTVETRGNTRWMKSRIARLVRSQDGLIVFPAEPFPGRRDFLDPEVRLQKQEVWFQKVRVDARIGWRFLGAARKGDKHADNVLRAAISFCLKERINMPRNMIAYAAEKIVEGIYVPNKTQRIWKNQHRDWSIVITILEVITEFGLKPTRSSQRRESACSIVHKALAGKGINMSEDSVQEIWKNRSKPAVERLNMRRTKGKIL